VFFVKKFDQQLLRLKTVLGVTSDQEVAGLLGLTKAAFSDRKKRDSFPEDKLLALVAREPKRGIDAHYVLTGEHLSVAQARAVLAAQGGVGAAHAQSNATTSSHLAPDEELLLEAYNALKPAARKKLLASLLTGGKSGLDSKRDGVNVTGSKNRIAGRDYHEGE
jgi:hypothetical protein